MDERSRQLGGERGLEALVGRLGHQDDVRLEQVAAETGGATLELGSGPPLCEVVEEVRDEVALGQPLDEPHLLDPHGDLAGDRARELDAPGRVRDDQAEQLVVGDERRGDATAAGPGRELGAELRERDARARGRPRRVGAPEPEVVPTAFDQVHVACLGVEQSACAVRHRRKQLLERLGAGDRLGELGQRLELVDAALHLAVQAGVLDRARDERRGGHHEFHLVRRELSRRLGVRGDDADDVAALALDRDGEERLEPLLLELRDVLDAGVVEEVLRDESRLPVLGGPPGEALTTRQLDLAGEVRVRLGRRPENELAAVVLDEVEEACVHGARVGERAAPRRTAPRRARATTRPSRRCERGTSPPGRVCSRPGA